MRLPGPLGWLSLVLSVMLAGPPAIMAALSLTGGDYVVGAFFLGVAVLMFVLPEYVIRRIPGPREYLRRRLPWRRGD